MVFCVLENFDMYCAIVKAMTVVCKGFYSQRSLMACMAVSLCAGNSLMVSAPLGACMASLAVKSVGNLPIQRSLLQNMLIVY